MNYSYTFKYILQIYLLTESILEFEKIWIFRILEFYENFE